MEVAVHARPDKVERGMSPGPTSQRLAVPKGAFAREAALPPRSGPGAVGRLLSSRLRANAAVDGVIGKGKKKRRAAASPRNLNVVRPLT